MARTKTARVARSAHQRAQSREPAEPPQPPRPRKSRSSRVGKTPEKVAAVRSSVRAAVLREKINAPPQWSYVFVGNLSPLVQVDHLKKHFTTCGFIKQVDIRCGRGTVTMGPEAHDDPNAFNYATVLFTTVRGVTKAILRDGSSLCGRQITVSTTTFQLPEVIGIKASREPGIVRFALPLQREATLVLNHPPAAAVPAPKPSSGSSSCSNSGYSSSWSTNSSVGSKPQAGPFKQSTAQPRRLVRIFGYTVELFTII